MADYELAVPVATLGSREAGIFTAKLSNNAVQVATDSGHLIIGYEQAVALRDHLLKMFPIDDMMGREWCDG